MVKTFPTFVNKYEGRSNGGIPCFSEERLQERAAKVSTFYSGNILTEYSHEIKKSNTISTTSACQKTQELLAWVDMLMRPRKKCIKTALIFHDMRVPMSWQRSKKPVVGEAVRHSGS
jgi:hypothetical protein